mmetsp:Transcript_10037/g.27398  ORF Transcript_10037/g.27398 Transcript_10037/m.27398 type:complete len:405 (+) Transcript_10037:11485-12699(+)
MGLLLAPRLQLIQQHRRIALHAHQEVHALAHAHKVQGGGLVKLGRALRAVQHHQLALHQAAHAACGQHEAAVAIEHTLPALLLHVVQPRVVEGCARSVDASVQEQLALRVFLHDGKGTGLGAEPITLSQSLGLRQVRIDGRLHVVDRALEDHQLVDRHHLALVVCHLPPKHVDHIASGGCSSTLAGGGDVPLQDGLVPICHLRVADVCHCIVPQQVTAVLSSQNVQVRVHRHRSVCKALLDGHGLLLVGRLLLHAFSASLPLFTISSTLCRGLLLRLPISTCFPILLLLLPITGSLCGTLHNHAWLRVAQVGLALCGVAPAPAVAVLTQVEQIVQVCVAGQPRATKNDDCVSGGTDSCRVHGTVLWHSLACRSHHQPLPVYVVCVAYIHAGLVATIQHQLCAQG